ncbi:MAG: MCE family protein [Muribaculaceae bacterium]|nr:MCE family protein [Muribaculaceae bacterium]
MKSLFNKNVVIALTVIASLCLLYWGIEFLKGVNLFKPANFYYAEFEQVDGLVEASPVMVNGFQVGQVREIDYDYNTNRISVMMSMNRDMKIPVGSKASIETSLTGTATMVLNLAKGDVYMKVGDTMMGYQANGLMGQISGEVMPQVTQILPKVDSIMMSVNGLLASPQVAASVMRLDAITAQLAQSSQQLTQLIINLNKGMPAVMGNVNGITQNLSATTDNLNQLSSSLNGMPLDSTMRQIHATVANLQLLTAQLNNPESSLGQLLNDKSLYQNADKVLADLDSLFIDIKKNPKRYINVKVF